MREGRRHFINHLAAGISFNWESGEDVTIGVRLLGHGCGLV